MQGYIKNIKIKRLFDRFDLEQNFTHGVNVLYGDNGSFKTTLLHVIANVLGANFDRFVFLNFESIWLQLDDGRIVKLHRFKDRDEVTGESDHLIEVNFGNFYDLISTNEIESQNPISLAQLPGRNSDNSLEKIPSVMYFPAFRTVIEAFRSVNKSSSDCEVSQQMRSWLLPFTPQVSYPTMSDIEQSLMNPDERLSHNSITRYFESVNSFLKGKKLTIYKDSNRPFVSVLHSNGTYSRLGALSSGERQIVTLLFAAVGAKSPCVLLIDEPEDSLHVAWQRKLLGSIFKLSPGQQIISCTHSPVIAAEYDSQEINSSISSEIPEDIYEF